MKTDPTTGHLCWDPTNEADLLEWAWGIIANAHGGDWDNARPDWKLAASNWRDAYHTWLRKHLDDKKKEVENCL